jgi:CRISPR system Cascade subunit CasA
VSYEPAPLTPAGLLDEQASATLNETAVRNEMIRLAPGAEWDGRRLDRLSLLAAALTANPEIAHARATAAAAAAEARAARVLQGPTLLLTTEYAFNAPEASPWQLGVAGDVLLDTGARRESRINSADLGARIASFDYTDTAWSVRLQIRNALAQHLLAQKEVETAKKLAALRERQLTAMEHRLSAGTAAHTDVERARAQLATDNRRLADAEARAADAKLQLAAAVGVAPGAIVESALSWPGIDAPQELTWPLPEVCLVAALVARPDVARASLTYDQAEEGLRNAVASQYPQLHLGPGYAWERGLKKLPLVLSLSLPPLDLNHAAIAAAEARRVEAGQALEMVVAAAANAVAVAQQVYAAAWIQLEQARQQSRIAVRLAAQADTAISAGAIDRFEWNTAQSGRMVAELDELTAVQDVRSAEASLENALRRPLDGPELAITTGQIPSEDSTCQMPLPLQPALHP